VYPSGVLGTRPPPEPNFVDRARGATVTDQPMNGEECSDRVRGRSASLWCQGMNTATDSLPPTWASTLELEPHEIDRHPEIPVFQPGPPFNAGDIVLCTPEHGRRKIALVLEASPPAYKILLEDGTRIDTAVERADVMPDWNHDHPDFAPRYPEPFVEERRLLAQGKNKRRLEVEDIDIHRRAKRRRVAFADPPAQQPFQLQPTPKSPVSDEASQLPPADISLNRAPPPEPPPTEWASQLIPLNVWQEDKGSIADSAGIAKAGGSWATASTTPLDDETLTTMSCAGSESDWSVSDDEHDDQGKPTSLMQPQHLAEVHPFIKTLHEWKEGIEVDCGEDWEWSTIGEAVLRGPHPTACTEES